jgi:PAS domain S-box-containing protein
MKSAYSRCRSAGGARLTAKRKRLVAEADTKPEGMSPTPELRAWRERIVASFYLLGTFIGGAVLLVTGKLIIQEQLWLVGAFDLAAFAWAVTGLLLGQRLSYQVRSWGVLTALYLLGAVLLYKLGPVSGAPLWLFTFAVAAGFLQGVRAAVAALALNAATLAAIGFMVQAQALPWLAEWPVYPERWWVLAFNIVMLNALVASAVAFAFRAVSTSLAKEGEARARLEQANQSLREEAKQRSAAEQALRESEERYRLSFSTSPDAININRMDGTYVDTNQGFTALTGFTRDDVIGRPSSEIGIWSDPADRQRLIEGLTRDGQVVNLEARFRKKDGSLTTALMSANIITLGGEPHILSITRDVEERRRAQEALAKSEARFRELFEDAPIAYHSLDGDGVILDVNKAWLACLGYTKAEAVGRWFGDFLVPDVLPRFRECFAHFKQAGSISGVELNLRAKDGSSILATLNGSLAGDPLRNSIRGHCVFLDITEHRRLEEQLRQAQKMEAVGTLAGGIAHDFNNILGAVIGYTELAQETAREGGDNGQELAQVLAAAERARGLVQQILAFSRKAAADPKPVNLNQTVRQALKLLAPTLPKMIDIRTSLAEDLRLVSADPTQMDQVLLNLAANAADAMPEGGGLTIATANITLDAGQSQILPEAGPGDYVMLSVSDTGHGMDKATAGRIFDPFYTTKEVGKGTGLGLATAYGAVNGHGGHIQCMSQPGQGTTFAVYLPALPAGTVAAAEPGQPPESPARGHETILLVDDEQALRTFGALTLEHHGYQVLTAASGEEALELYRRKQGRVDLVLMDLGMPGMGGHKALRAILELDPRARVVIASGYSADLQVKDALAAGASGYVAKPFRGADLLAQVRQALDGERP